MIIYKCTGLTTKRIYIGKTVRSLEIRKYEHLKELRNNYKGGLWQKDFNLYGEQDFVFELVQEVPEVNNLSDIEIELITSFNTLEPNGYNKTKSSGPNYSTAKLSEISGHSIETLENIMLLAISIPYKKVDEIARACSVTANVVADLLNCKSYTWLSSVSPSLYKEIATINNSACTRSTYLKSLDLIYAMDLYVNSNLSDKEIATICSITTSALRDLLRQKAYLTLKEVSPVLYNQAVDKYLQKNLQRVKEKTIIDTSTDTWYTFNTCAEGSRMTGIDHRRISDLVGGHIKKYKTFVLL
jgi:hypothetical protein